MNNVRICIPSRNRAEKLSKLIKDLHSSGILDDRDVFVFESVTKTECLTHRNLYYKHSYGDVSFSGKLRFFLEENRGKYVLLMSDDDEYDFIGLRNLLLLIDRCIAACDELLLFQIFGDGKFDFPKCIRDGRLPFYLISSYVFKVGCDAGLELMDSIWYQNFLLHEYYTKSFISLTVNNPIVKYVEGDGFVAAAAIKDFNQTLCALSRVYGVEISSDKLWYEYRYTQRRLAKKLVFGPNRHVSSSDAKFFRSFRRPLGIINLIASVLLYIRSLFG